MNAYRRLEDLERIGIKLGLRNIKTILEELGNPQQSYPSILIAGTNGKGSVGAMLNSILIKQGYKTGHYTSPHLVDIRERIRVADNMISPELFETCLTKVFAAIDELTRKQQMETPPTYFETLTAAAFLCFNKTTIQMAIVEVGLGGRFDATNALNQTLSIITSIDYDHEEFLGKSLAQIASEKAGIFKSRVPIVAGQLRPEADEVITEAARKLECRMHRFDAQSIANLRLEDDFPVFDYRPLSSTVRVQLRGRHQAANAGVALTACDALNSIGFDISRSAVIEGLAAVRWPGRLDLLSIDPPVLLDCAHNPMGARALAEFLNETGRNSNIALFTAMKDKRIQAILAEIAPRIRLAVLTQVPPLNRCAGRNQLEQACALAGIDSYYCDSVTEALNFATKKAKDSDIPLVIFGSIYLAGEILQLAGQAPRS
jgi:dihydrofolate synthase/folylpolyglutamate synthase